MTSSLTTLSSSLSLLSGVGDTLDKARGIKQQALDLSHKCETVTTELEEYQAEVDECVQKKYYQAASLRLLAKSLQEKRVGVVKSAEDILKLATAVVTFHEDVEKVSLILYIWF